jgi:hypothetical protein
MGRIRRVGVEGKIQPSQGSLQDIIKSDGLAAGRLENRRWLVILAACQIFETSILAN